MARAKVSNKLRREQITQATLALIARKGVSGLTMSALAREVGVSEATLYRHFKNKEDILFATISGIGEGLRSNLEQVFKESDTATPLEQLKIIFMNHLGHLEKNTGIPRLVFSEEVHVINKRLKERLSTSIRNFGMVVEAIILDGQEDGSIKSSLDGRASAFSFIGMIQVSVFRWSLSDFSYSLLDEGQKLWENFERLIRS
ncbi:MAG TPA: TetR/AcrR family transcriptional regulator [Dissulfurispiraceae bacterium]|nr:TetR/AcrR family transcriptional regulator [Dissulfurispiraceae bacterium]